MRDGMNSGWRKSRRCETSDCVELDTQGGDVLMRDSKNPDGVVLKFSEKEWLAFCVSARDGRTGQTAVDVLRLDVGVGVARADDSDRRLTFTTEEWDTFVDGVVDGEFDEPTAAVKPPPLLIAAVPEDVTSEEVDGLREAFAAVVPGVELRILRGVTSLAYVPPGDRK